MVSNIYLLLGVQEGASLAEIKRAYGRLMRTLEADDLRQDEGVRQRVQSVRERLSLSFEHLKDPEVRRAIDDAFDAPAPGHEAKDHCRPKLGQMLVAAGLLTLDQLDAVLAIQRNTGHEHIPVGELMVAAGYITEKQLDYYLRQQKLMRLPSNHPERWGQRLIDMGMINDDQLKIALIEQQSTGSTLRQAMINRGFLTVTELDRIF